MNYHLSLVYLSHSCLNDIAKNGYFFWQIREALSYALMHLELLFTTFRGLGSFLYCKIFNLGCNIYVRMQPNDFYLRIQHEVPEESMNSKKLHQPYSEDKFMSNKFGETCQNGTALFMLKLSLDIFCATVSNKPFPMNISIIKIPTSFHLQWSVQISWVNPAISDLIGSDSQRDDPFWQK